MQVRSVKLLAIATVFAVVLSSYAIADSITFGGIITQSIADGTGPAVNNPALNNILAGDNYLVTLTFAGSITAPGTCPLPGATLQFSDLDASVTEASFNSVSLSVLTDGASYDLSLLGCLTTGSDCAVGNQLDANFKIAAASLNAQDVVALAFFPITPLDLLEDDGVTDIQGSVTKYSYIGASPIPEPSMLFLLIAAVTAIALQSRRCRMSCYAPYKLKGDE
jgi:hypothetical protein